MEEYNKKTENCMMCGEELEYLTTAIPVTCTYCDKAESANIHCPLVITYAMNAMPVIQLRSSPSSVFLQTPKTPWKWQRSL